MCKYFPIIYPATLPMNNVVMLKSIRTKDHCFISLLSKVPTSGAAPTISKTQRIEATETHSNTKPMKISYLIFPILVLTPCRYFMDTCAVDKTFCVQNLLNYLCVNFYTNGSVPFILIQQEKCFSLCFPASLPAWRSACTQAVASV